MLSDTDRAQAGRAPQPLYGVRPPCPTNSADSTLTSHPHSGPARGVPPLDASGPPARPGPTSSCTPMRRRVVGRMRSIAAHISSSDIVHGLDPARPCQVLPGPDDHPQFPAWTAVSARVRSACPLSPCPAPPYLLICSTTCIITQKLTTSVCILISLSLLTPPPVPAPDPSRTLLYGRLKHQRPHAHIYRPFCPYSARAPRGFIV